MNDDTTQHGLQFLRVRRDALPEDSHYEDSGCKLAPKCLECPLPRCRYDVHGGNQVFVKQRRKLKVTELRKQGYSPPEIAKLLNISIRSVHRLTSNEG